MSAVAVSIVYQGLSEATGQLVGMVDALVDLGHELEARMGVLNRFEGSLEGLAERTGGLVSELRAMQVHSDLMRRGINLSARDLNNVLVRSIETGAATGRDFNQVVEQLSSALGSGAPRALQQFGISIDRTGDRSRDITAALASLEDQVGEVSSRADTAGGSLDIMATAADNARTAFAEAFDASSDLAEGIGDLVTALTGVDASFGDVMDALGSAATRAGVIVGAVLAEMTTAIRQTVEIFQAVGRGDFAAAGQHLLQQQSTVQLRGLADRINEGQERVNARRAARESGSGETTVSGDGRGRRRRGGGGEREFTYDEGLQAAQERQYASQVEIAERAADRLRTIEEETATAKAQLDEQEAARIDELRDKAEDNIRVELEGVRRIAEARQEAFEKAKEAARAQRAASQQLAGEAASAANTIAQAYNNAFQQAIEGTMSLEQAAIEATKSLLKSFGQELIAKGIGKILEGIAEIPSPTAATKIGGGTAMVAFGVGLGAAGAAIPSAGAAGAEQPREEPRSDSARGPQNVTVIMQNAVMTAGTEAQLARGLRKSLSGDRVLGASLAAAA